MVDNEAPVHSSNEEDSDPVLSKPAFVELPDASLENLKSKEDCPPSIVDISSTVVTNDPQPTMDASCFPLTEEKSVVTPKKEPLLSPPSDTHPQIKPECSNKSRLHWYTQHNLFGIPKYSTINEGLAHAPKFRSTVLVQGLSFTSPNTYSHIKAAEQDVAKYALDSLESSNINDGGRISSLSEPVVVELPEASLANIVSKGDCTPCMIDISSTTVAVDPVKDDPIQASYLPLIEEKSVVSLPSDSHPQIDSDNYFMNKNRLQHYTQRASIKNPKYCTINEGLPHAPKFRSTVLVNGLSFTSPSTHSHIKAAEQDVAKVALDSLSKEIICQDSSNLCNGGGFSFLNKDVIFCKSILEEFATKTRSKKPVYTTNQLENAIPTFVSSVTFNDKIYNGDPGPSKRKAERFAALTAILSYQDADDPSVKAILLKIIASKFENHIAPELAASKAPNEIVPALTSQGSVAAQVPLGQAHSPQTCYVPFRKPDADAQQTGAPPVMDFVPALQCDTASGPMNKRKRKSRKKNIKMDGSTHLAKKGGNALSSFVGTPSRPNSLSARNITSNK